MTAYCHNESADKALAEGNHHLNNRYDYRTAITHFLQASNLYEREPSTEEIKKQSTLAWTGLAMAYHNVGESALRDHYMNKAQNLLEIPDNISYYTDPQRFTESAIAYCTVDGYRKYIDYEQCNRSGGPLAEQEAHLQQANRSFFKALEIAQNLHLENDVCSHAQHGIGTMYEFLGACQEARGNIAEAAVSIRQSTDAFEKALALRKKLLGTQHLHVARSYHKTARSYCHLARLLPADQTQQQKELLKRANTYYQEAIALFEKQGVPKEQAKYHELTQEYLNFTNAYAAQNA